MAKVAVSAHSFRKAECCACRAMKENGRRIVVAGVRLVDAPREDNRGKGHLQEEDKPPQAQTP